MKYTNENTSIVFSENVSRYTSKKGREVDEEILGLARTTSCGICHAGSTGENAVGVVQQEGNGRMKVFGVCGDCAAGQDTESLVQALNEPELFLKEKAARRSAKKGVSFQTEILGVLDSLRQRHPDSVTVISQPTIELQTDAIRVPDFDLHIRLPQETLKYFIEVQDRQRVRTEILHKINYIRTKSKRKTFIFVYREKLGDSLFNELSNEGVMVYSLPEFNAYVKKYDELLNACERIPRVEQPRDNAMLAEVPYILPACAVCGGEIKFHTDVQECHIELLQQAKFPEDLSIRLLRCTKCDLQYFADATNLKVRLLVYIEAKQASENYFELRLREVNKSPE